MRSATLIALLAVGTLFAGYSTFAQEAPTEYQVKAAYLFNFLKFVDWPSDKDTHGPWIIGVVGSNPIADELTRLVSAKSVQGRALQIRTFQAAEDMRGCNVLFISASEKNHLPSILAGLHGAGVLTVADMEHFIESGGMIQFVTDDSRVRLAIDVGATSRARLKVSSKLLSLARSVTGTEQSANNP